MLLLDPFFCLSRNQRNLQFIISYPRPAGQPQRSSNPERRYQKLISIRMGNCWGTTPVTNHNSPTPTKPSTPGNISLIVTFFSWIPWDFKGGFLFYVRVNAETTWNHSKENGLGSRSSSHCKALPAISSDPLLIPRSPPSLPRLLLLGIEKKEIKGWLIPWYGG